MKKNNKDTYKNLQTFIMFFFQTKIVENCKSVLKSVYYNNFQSAKSWKLPSYPVTKLNKVSHNVLPA